MGWATFWAIFSQTHLVTLPPKFRLLGWLFTLDIFLKNAEEVQMFS
jgi:hypothetical protein